MLFKKINKISITEITTGFRNTCLIEKISVFQMEENQNFVERRLYGKRVSRDFKLVSG
jgi:hypothetical protein